MAILWADGFDDWVNAGAAGEYDAYAAAIATVGGTSGRRGGGSLFLNLASDYFHRTLAASYTELFASIAYRPATLGNAGVLTFYDGATAILTVRINTDGSISAHRGFYFDTQIGAATAAGLVPANVYTHVQIRAVFSATVGVVQVRLNGATTDALSLTGQNTGGASANGVRIWGSNNLAAYFDDFVLGDTSGTVANSWLGDVRVDTYLPNANGDLSQLVGSDGDSTNNYALVNASAPGATYAQSATVGAEDLYGVANMAHNPVAILGVVATAAARKDDAGTRAIRLHAKSGATDARSAADINLGTSRARVYTVFEVDPDTGVAWTKAGFDAAQFGLEVTV